MNKDNKKFIVETLFLKSTRKHNLTLNEFLVLMYFDNEYDYTFDVEKVSKATCLNTEDVLEAFDKLINKNLITLKTVKDVNSGKYIDKVSLDNLYLDIKSNASDDNEEEKRKKFFDEFQKLYKHSLSQMDYEIINAWLANGMSEDLILGATKEADYNGVQSLRYIDKILYEWKKKGFNSMKDVEKHLTSKDDTMDDSISYKTEIFEYNWLDE